jgi:hypothetical protein
MPVTYANNSGVAYYGVAGSGGSLPCAFTHPNSDSNIGIAWITADEGYGPAGCTDSNGNIWRGFPGYFTNFGFSTLYVCTNLKAGANTVTVDGLVSPSRMGSQAPVLTVLEYATGGGVAGIQALQAALAVNGILGSWYQGSVLTLDALYSRSSGSWNTTLIAFINTTLSDTSGVSRTWSIGSVPAYATGSGVRSQYEDTGTLETGAVADCTIPSPNERVFITFTPTPTPPPPSPWPGPNTQLYTAVIGLLVTTP